MKLTKTKLKQIIREELTKVLEAADPKYDKYPSWLHFLGQAPAEEIIGYAVEGCVKNDTKRVEEFRQEWLAGNGEKSNIYPCLFDSENTIWTTTLNRFKGFGAGQLTAALDSGTEWHGKVKAAKEELIDAWAGGSAGSARSAGSEKPAGAGETGKAGTGAITKEQWRTLSKGLDSLAGWVQWINLNMNDDPRSWGAALEYAFSDETRMRYPLAKVGVGIMLNMAAKSGGQRDTSGNVWLNVFRLGSLGSEDRANQFAKLWGKWNDRLGYVPGYIKLFADLLSHFDAYGTDYKPPIDKLNRDLRSIKEDSGVDGAYGLGELIKAAEEGMQALSFGMDIEGGGAEGVKR